MTAEKKTDVPAKKRRLSKAWMVFLIVGGITLVADQATKVWARASLPVHPAGCSIPDDIVDHKCVGVPEKVIDGVWEWRLSFNPGSAFGLFSSRSGARVFLTVVGIAAVLGMLWMMKKARPDQKALHWALALVAGGAIGNLIDRVYFGVVTDFVLWRYEKHEWPVFNVADVALVAGVGLMFVDMWREGKLERAKKKQQQKKQATAED
jgi:signal peptidase II